MANKVLLKKSSVTGKTPLTTDLDYGELAINYADGKIFYKNTSNQIASISTGGSTTNNYYSAGGSFYITARASTVAVTVNVGNLPITARSGTVNVTI